MDLALSYHSGNMLQSVSYLLIYTFLMLCVQRSVLIRHAPLTLASANAYPEGHNQEDSFQESTQEQLMTVNITALSASISSLVKQAMVEALAERTQPSSSHSPEAAIAQQYVADAVGA